MAKDEPEGAWALAPMDEEQRAGLRDAALVVAKGVGGGVLTVFGVGFLLMPNMMTCKGATRSYVLQKQRQQRCMELGITLEELAARERSGEPLGELPDQPPPPARER